MYKKISSVLSRLIAAAACAVALSATPAMAVPVKTQPEVTQSNWLELLDLFGGYVGLTGYTGFTSDPVASLYLKMGSQGSSKGNNGAWRDIDEATYANSGGLQRVWSLDSLTFDSTSLWAVHLTYAGENFLISNAIGSSRTQLLNKLGLVEADLSSSEKVATNFGEFSFMATGMSLTSDVGSGSDTSVLLPSVPTPATLPLLLGAMGLGAVMLRRKKAKV